MGLAPALRGQRIVCVQSPIRLGPYSEPQPDLALRWPREDFYAASHLGPAGVSRIIGVAGSSADYDRTHRLPLYGRAGIPEALGVDLAREEAVVGRDPSPEGDRTLRTARRGETLTPLAFPDLILSVDEILGWAYILSRTRRLKASSSRSISSRVL